MQKAISLKHDIVTDLRDKAYGSFSKLVFSFPSSHSAKEIMQELKSLEALEQGGDLRKGLLGWSAKHNLDFDWCRDQAIKTMWRWLGYSGVIHRSDSLLEAPLPDILSWCHYTDLLSDLLFAGQEVSQAYKILQRFPPPDGLPFYNALRKTRREYLAHVQALVQKEKPGRKKSLLMKAEAYCNKIESNLNNSEFKKVVATRELETHLTWTIQYWVLHETVEEIADKESLDVETVGKAIKRLRNRI